MWQVLSFLYYLSSAVDHPAVKNGSHHEVVFQVPHAVLKVPEILHDQCVINMVNADHGVGPTLHRIGVLQVGHTVPRAVQRVEVVDHGP